MLHLEQNDNVEAEIRTIVRAKNQRTQEKIVAGDFNFEGAQLVGFSVKGKELSEANFFRATFLGHTSFEGATFIGAASFSEATFSGSASFSEATFNGDTLFVGATFRHLAWFQKATFRGKAMFGGATFGNNVWFSKATFSGATFFRLVTFSHNTWFNEATFISNASFDRVTFEGDIKAKNTIFNIPATQETLCRIAKRNCEERGDKDEADRYYYREMEAKRKQKGNIRRYSEVMPFEWVLAYGVKPFRTFAVWGGVVAVFALYYWLVQALSGANSFWACLYFSVMTAITPGYGRFDIKPEMFLPVSIEAVFGAFMWVAIITILTRKFFRT